MNRAYLLLFLALLLSVSVSKGQGFVNPRIHTHTHTLRIDHLVIILHLVFYILLLVLFSVEWICYQEDSIFSLSVRRDLAELVWCCFCSPPLPSRSP
jgi:uncharacterized protein HemY